MSPGLRNCHVRGLDSIVLSRYPDGRPHRRMFVAHEHHELWLNRNEEGRFSVAIHAHKTPLVLTLVAGSVFQIRARLSPRGHGDDLYPWRFESAITGGGRFVRAGVPVNLIVCTPTPLEREFMAADALHTVWVPRLCKSAWIVQEGLPDATGSDVCYSNTDLDNWSADGLYEPMTQDECDELVRSVWGWA